MPKLCSQTCDPMPSLLLPVTQAFHLLLQRLRAQVRPSPGGQEGAAGSALLLLATMHTAHRVSTRKQLYAGCKAFLLMLPDGQQSQGLPPCPAASAFSSRLSYGRVLPALGEAPPPPPCSCSSFLSLPVRTAAQEAFRAWMLPCRWKGRKGGTACNGHLR